MKTEVMTQRADTEVTFVIPNTETLGQLKDMTPGFSLTMQYKSADDWAASKDKEVRCFYQGMKEVPNEDGEMVNCGMFVAETECFISGQKVLVEAVKSLPLGTPLAITYKGKKANKSTEGQTMIFEVVILK